MKKHLFILLTVFFFMSSQGQILNGSFENGPNADLSNWAWSCGAVSSSLAPVGGGSWCIQVNGGNTQGCFPGYAYQKIPTITNGQNFLLSGWAFAQGSPTVGIYFGKINNGTISLQSGATTASTSWTQLSLQSGFSLSSGDTALVVLHGGLTGGPLQGYGYFDQLSLQQVTGIKIPGELQQVKIFYDPFSKQVNFQAEKSMNHAKISIVNLLGQSEQQADNISGLSFSLQNENLSNGVYFIRVIQDNQVIAAKKLMVAN